ncbi:tetratricopeptide repeat protein [Flammeovirga sp. EKP202]|uniref:tetratricopeptide repeat protein n=1 Tax=Flammeovirga sp. EKP202 TaxID=2770592 RepID=UPI00165F95BE|nr:tetratricopeptide repeat protein [Flammeovirga sp. EKP202]MBD0400913.1 tetratricopeptide repeat protein [Flammeovirga sp. EKP202]
MKSTYLLILITIKFTVLHIGLSITNCIAQEFDAPKIEISQDNNSNSNKCKSLFEVNNTLQKDPLNSNALFLRGKIKIEMGAFKGAQTDLTLALRDYRSKNRIEIYYLRGLSYYMENDFLNAIADFDSVIFIQPHHIDALWKKAQSYYFLGANGEAISLLDNITRINPDNPITWHDLGALYYKNKMLDKAKDCFTKSLILNPQLSISYNHRGIIYENQKQYSLAFDDFTRAIQYDTTYVDAYNNRGLIYMHFEDYSQAEGDFSDAILHSKDTAKEALNNRALARCILGNYEESLDDINDLIDNFPFYSQAYITRGDIKEYMHDDSGACSDWQKAAELGNLIGIQYTQSACH